MASKASPAATDRQDCAGLRSRPACLPAVAYVNSIRLADPRCCPKDGDTKTLSLRGTKKAAYPAAIFVRAKGLEPIRTRHQILSLAWLPITTRSQNLPEDS